MVNKKIVESAIRSLKKPGGSLKPLPKTESKTKPVLYLFRHGETYDNKRRLFSGWRQSRLTKKGIKQEAILAKKLRNKRIDLGIIDWLVNNSARGTIGISKGIGWTDNNCVDGAVNGTAKGVLDAGSAMRQIQTGQLKTYLSWVVVGILILAIIFGSILL